MASINGVQIKNLKSFIGREGIACQGTVYLEGKKLGFWIQDGNGGCSRYEFDERLLYDATQRVKETRKGQFTEIYDCDLLLEDICNLAQYEKKYKSCVKKGITQVVYLWDWDTGICFTANYSGKLDARLLNTLLDGLARKTQVDKNKLDYCLVNASSLSDFDLIIN